jgi:hypothetical protein
MPAPKDPEQYAKFDAGARERMRKMRENLPPEREAERIRKSAESRRGQKRPDMVGDRNPMRRPEIAAKVKGPRVDLPTYGGIHDRLEAWRGMPCDHSCDVCGGAGSRREWALLHEAPLIEIDGRGRRFSLDLNDYVLMCASCHRRYDRGTLSL